MKFNLIDYQRKAAAEVTGEVLDGFRRFDELGKRKAVSLSAPTGAGKTVIATAAIEALWYGTDRNEPHKDVTVLWVTDDPSLNQQTRRKMLVASSQIKPRQLVSVDQSFDQYTFDQGRVYFVHIQQLGKGATRYVEKSNNRTHTLWETIANTIRERGHEFVLVIDEAHRGTRSKKGGGKTITAQLMAGADGKLPPAPVVVGISATPQRFVDAVTKAGGRTLELLDVDPEDVRQSGLLKDKIAIKHPAENQPGDSTLIELAVKDLRGFHRLWQEYSDENDEPLVRPALVIQLKAGVSDSDARVLLDTLRTAWPKLDGKAIGHSLQDHGTWNLGDRTVRYVSPPDIQDDPHLRVVLFKEALTTGWDCPRAEVMVSLRLARDHTYIAQLIGRMVRTPLARRVSGTSDVLNTVSLYLPYFDAKGVNSVVAGLRSGDAQIATDLELQPITCGHNMKVSEGIWDLLGDLPTFTRPAKYHRNEVARLNALAMLLTGCGCLIDATKVARKHLVDTLKREAVSLKDEVEANVKDYRVLDYEIRTITVGTDDATVEEASIAVNARNIEDLFRRAKRTLGDAAAKWYWSDLCDSGTDPDDAKILTAALAANESVPSALDKAASELIARWRKKYNADINALLDAKRVQFYSIWQQAKAPQQITMLMPPEITAPSQRIEGRGDSAKAVNLDRYRLHIYSDGKGTFPVHFQSTWERDIVEVELSKETLVGWYRNPTGGQRALAVPYDQSGTARTMYPDLLFFHETDDGVVVDIVDPHRPDSADTGPKWTGFARYAATHGQQVRRVLAVIKDEDQFLSLDLRNPDVLDALEEAYNETDIRKLFANYGGNY